MKIIDRGILIAGVVGGRRAIATRPSVTVLDDGTLLASYRVGSTKDCDDEVSEIRWSKDSGRTWSEPVSPFASTVGGVKGTVTQVLVTRLGEGRLIAAALWINREAFPGKGLFNAETEGCLPMSVLVADSTDGGHSWTPWRLVPMPDDIGPPSLTNAILALADGTLILSVETNKTYLDAGHWRQRLTHIKSSDGGKTWGAPVTISEDPSARIFYWDQRGGVAPDGTIVTFSWTYDRKENRYLDIHRNLSRDGGKTWRGFDSLGFSDQASHPAMLPDGRIVLAWVDRFGSSSIRARISAGPEAPFSASTEVIVYQHPRKADGSGDTGELLEQMGQWSYGLPYAEVLPSGEVIILYYAGTDRCIDIRWARLAV